MTGRGRWNQTEYVVVDRMNIVYVVYNGLFYDLSLQMERRLKLLCPTTPRRALNLSYSDVETILERIDLCLCLKKV